MGVSRRWVTLVAGLTLGVAAVSATEAAVLTTIGIDGDMSDWTAVLADPYQTAYDGPALGLPDRDAPVQSTGRDLEAFAWTYDAAYLFFYTARSASASNKQEFWYYIDTDEDDRMQSGEPVIGVTWKGSNRSTTVVHYTYTAAAAGGDPLGDPSGFADGWTMPGTVGFLQTLETVSGGAANGVEMEARVAWTVLGIASGTPVRFHVSASNSPNIPQQIDDNMGGPGGLVGSTRFAGVTIAPDRAGDAVPSGDAVLAHVVTNTGQSSDTFDLTWSAAGAFVPTAVSWYADVNGDGLRDPGDLLLVDTNGDAIPDTGPLAVGATLDILAVITAPAGVSAGETSDVVTTATSAGVSSVSDSVTDTVTIVAPAMTLVKSVDLANADPGDTLSYSVVYTSSGTSTASNVVIVDAVPPETAYLAGSSTGPGTLIEFSHDGGASYDGSESTPVTHIRWTVLAPLSPSDSGTVSFQAVVR